MIFFAGSAPQPIYRENDAFHGGSPSLNELFGDEYAGEWAIFLLHVLLIYILNCVFITSIIYNLLSTITESDEDKVSDSHSTEEEDDD